MNKKIKAEIAGGVIMTVAVVIGGVFWLQGKDKLRSGSSQSENMGEFTSSKTPIVVRGDILSSETSFAWTPLGGSGFIVRTYPGGNDEIRQTGGRVYLNAVPFPEADPSTFAVATYQYGTETIYTGYAKDKNKIYYISRSMSEYPINIQTIAGADPETFAPLYNALGIEVDQENVARDKNRVYMGHTPILGADPNTFSLVFVESPYIEDVPKSSGPSRWATVYSKDKNYVYWRGQIFAGADPLTFEYLNYVYVKDKNHVYYDAPENRSFPALLPYVDPASFRVSKTPLLYTDVEFGFELKLPYEFGANVVSKKGSTIGFHMPTKDKNSTEGNKVSFAEVFYISAMTHTESDELQSECREEPLCSWRYILKTKSHVLYFHHNQDYPDDHEPLFKIISPEYLKQNITLLTALSL